MANDLDIEGTLKILEEQISSLSDKIRSGRISDPKKEEIRMKMIRTLGYLSKTYVQLKQAQKIEELAEKVAELDKIVRYKEEK